MIVGYVEIKRLPSIISFEGSGAFIKVHPPRRASSATVKQVSAKSGFKKCIQPFRLTQNM